MGAMIGVMTGEIIGAIVEEMTGARLADRHTGAPNLERFGRAIAPSIGNMNIAVGANVEDTEGTAFQTIASARILAVDAGFACAAPQSWS